MNIQVIEKAVAKYYPELVDLPIQKIGEGSYAKAYKVGDRVFKITADDHDAMASLRVKGKDLQHVVKIHAVYKIDINLSEDEDEFLIVSDYVPLDIHFVEKYSKLRKHLEGSIHRLIGVALRAGIDEVEYEEFTREFGYSEEVVQELYTFTQELIDHKFTNADFHLDNVRVGADGKFKFIDLGFGTSRGVDVASIKFEELV